jgi:hypothetical protein
MAWRKLDGDGKIGALRCDDCGDIYHRPALRQHSKRLPLSKKTFDLCKKCKRLRRKREEPMKSVLAHSFCVKVGLNVYISLINPNRKPRNDDPMYTGLLVDVFGRPVTEPSIGQPVCLGDGKNNRPMFETAPVEKIVAMEDGWVVVVGGDKSYRVESNRTYH